MLHRIVACLLLCSLFALPTQAQDIEKVLEEKPWDWSGSIGGNANVYGVEGIDRRSNPFFWNLTARMTGRVYGFELPFSLTLGQHDFTFSRPFFQLGASPSYKWIKAHLGTRSLTYSPYTLAGHVFNGAGVELTPGKFRFAAMAGQFRRAREYDPDVDYRFHPVLYRRTGHAMKVGFGTEESHFDLIYFRAKDDESSISMLPPDTTTTPAENAVVGFTTKFRIAKSIGFFADGAVSAFTRNLNSEDAIDYIDPDISSFFPTKFSTKLNYAVRGGISFDYPSFGLKASYERIMPEFETMGAYFFANDREVYSVSPRFSFLSRQLNVNGTLGLQRNNLLDTRMETTRNLTGMLNVSYFHPKGFGLNANYTNLSIEQFEGINELVDTFQVAMVTTNMSVAPMYSWSDSSRSQSVVLAATYQQLNDRNPFTREFTNMTTGTYNANYNLSFLRTGLGFNLGANYTTIDIFGLDTRRYGGTAGLSQRFGDQQFNLNASSTYNLTSVNGNSDGSVLTGNLNLSYNPKPKHSLSLYTNVIRNKSESFQDYTEVYGGLSYVYQLR